VRTAAGHYTWRYCPLSDSYSDLLHPYDRY